MFLCGIAGRRYTADYLPRILGRLSPRIVVPGHHDNFFRPLHAALGMSVNVNVAGFFDEVRAVSAEFSLRALDLCQTVRGA